MRLGLGMPSVDDQQAPEVAVALFGGAAEAGSCHRWTAAVALARGQAANCGQTGTAPDR